MCAIAGWAGTRTTTPPEEALGAMLGRLAHRGPDGEGAFHGGTNADCVALGHRRLAILDQEGGAQPMTAGANTVVFNGEIYNFAALRDELRGHGHRFATRSDTEVLLHAYAQWGADCVHHLSGMFAFALWDATERRLLLARDRFGEKPLFLARRPGGIAFASELKALLPLTGATLRPGAIDAYLAYRYVPGPATFFAGIEKLPPGHLALWRAGTLTVTRYWEPPDARARAPAAPPDLLALLGRSVADRMVADVPFGAFLSGGLDSSAIVALMMRHAGRADTFAVGFAVPGFSELDDAALVARHVGSTHHTTEVRAADYPALLPEATRARDAPVSEPSDVALLRLARLASTRVKMVLTGEGADELLGGYPKHRAERFSAAYRAVVPGCARALAAPLLRRLPRRAALAAEAMGVADEPDRLARWFGALTPRARRDLLAAHAAPYDIPPVRGHGPLRRVFHFDQTSWMPDNLLERGDRITMAASIEARMPFLDETLVAAISTLPDRARLDKRLLRRAVAPLLPAHTVARRKVGFRAPTDHWFRTDLRDYLLDHLGPAARTAPLYRRAALDRVLREHAAGIGAHGKLLWSLLSLEVFAREYQL